MQMDLSKPRLKPYSVPFKILNIASVNFSHDHHYNTDKVSKLFEYNTILLTI